MDIGIFQRELQTNGRTKVILSIVEVLNELDIKPDVITFKSHASNEKLVNIHDKNVNFSLREIEKPISLPSRLEIIELNLMLHKFTQKYDLLVNSNNSLAFLPNSGNFITYMYFPQKRRAETDLKSIHEPEEKISFFSSENFFRKFLQILYSPTMIKSNNKIIAQSKFVRKMIKEVYPEACELDIPVVYNPVELDKFWYEGRKRNEVSSLGRFGKRQIEIIKIAEEAPELRFNIMGLVTDNKYFEQCKKYVEEKNVSNVSLFPDCPFERVKENLRRSKFFIHNTRNEPAPLVTIQAIAAGCIPLTHDSGGEREAVPYRRLRFSDKGEAVEKLKTQLKNENLSELKDDLREHIKSHFSEQSFKKKMRKIFREHIS